jgi:YD repeat-containing protein
VPTKAGDLQLSRDPATGLLATTTLGTITTTISYNQHGEVVGLSASAGSQVLFSRTLGRDQLGRIVTSSETVFDPVQAVFTSASAAYEYSPIGQLLSASGPSAVLAYAFDGNGNRIEQNQVYDSQDRLASFGSISYTYDAMGQLASKTDVANGLPGGVTTYTYDAVGNLLGVVLPSGVSVAYTADAYGRRSTRSENGVTVGYIYRDQSKLVAMFSSDGTIGEQFIYASQSNVPDYMIKGGQEYRIVSDERGSVRLVVNTSDGTVAQRMDYDPWGLVTDDTNPGFQPFGFAGGLYDMGASVL